MKLTIMKHIFSTIKLVVILNLTTLLCEHAKYEPRSTIGKPDSPHVLQITPYNFNIVQDTFRMS